MLLLCSVSMEFFSLLPVLFIRGLSVHLRKVYCNFGIDLDLEVKPLRGSGRYGMKEFF